MHICSLVWHSQFSQVDCSDITISSIKSLGCQEVRCYLKGTGKTKLGCLPGPGSVASTSSCNFHGSHMGVDVIAFYKWDWSPGKLRIIFLISNNQKITEWRTQMPVCLTSSLCFFFSIEEFFLSLVWHWSSWNVISKCSFSLVFSLYILRYKRVLD